MIYHLALCALAVGALAQSSNSTKSGSSAPTMTVFLAGTATTGFAGSIVSANACETIYALECTDNNACSSGLVVTATEAPSSWQAQYITKTGGLDATISESCKLQGTTQAVCAETVIASDNGQTTAMSTTSTLSGTNVRYGQIPITGGTMPTGSCTRSGNAAAPTLMGDVLKVAVVPAVAVAFAGALL